MLLISISSHVPYSISKHCIQTTQHRLKYRREVREPTNSLTMSGERTKQELCNRKKSKNKHTPF